MSAISSEGRPGGCLGLPLQGPAGSPDDLGTGRRFHPAIEIPKQMADVETGSETSVAER